MKLNKRKCKQCGKEFQKQSPLQSVCDVQCAISRGNDLNKKKREADSRKETKEWKEKLLTHSDYLNLLQKFFNTYIRLRDSKEKCISCDCEMINRKGDASHYFSVGANQNLRFNEDNVHLSCVPCNQYKHGNISEYTIRLPFRIGYERFKELQEQKNVVSKLSIPEIKEKITYYKQKIKELK